MKNKKPTLQNRKFRQAYSWAQLRYTIAFQVVALREHHGWDRATLAKKIGVAESAIARLENANRDHYNVADLKKLADVFDLGLVLRFVSFSEIKSFAEYSAPQTLQPLSWAEENGRLKSA